ncbi:MAG: hypothetical protein PVG82_00850 [Chromatiales bacterium]
MSPRGLQGLSNPLGPVVVAYARKLIGIALLLVALAHVVLGAVYLIEDLLGSTPMATMAAATEPMLGASSERRAAYAVCLMLSAPLVLSGGLVLFRAGGRHLVEAAGALIILCAALGAWLTVHWTPYLLGALIGVVAVLLAQDLPARLPLIQPEPGEPSSQEGPPARRAPYDAGDKLLLGLIALSLIGLVVALVWS